MGNLQELVYKQGQAGITKATVTVVFNNSDPTGSPVGYESHKQITVTRQVVIGGKNKYMINGHTVQQSQVQNLFHSVQLNVNNPHFLIMQGRITKVLNMKPVETLSMIEEAAGTRMFETKKQAAIKTIEKKQLKVDELTKCMNEEINPTLENLRGEKQHYLTWQANSLELERLERFCIASEYRAAETKVQSAENDKDNINAELSSLKIAQKDGEAAAEDCGRKAAEIEALRNAEAEGEFKDLKKAEGDLSKDLVKVDTLLRNHKETMANEAETSNLLIRQAEAANVAVSDKDAELQRCNQELVTKEAKLASAEQGSSALRDKYQNACAGVADESSAELLSLPEQVGAWEKREREAESQLRQSSLRADHAKESLKELRKTTKAQQASHGTVLKDADVLRKKVTTMEERLQGLAANSAAEVDLRSRSSTLRTAVSTLEDQVDALSVQLQARLNFEFKDPERGFDRSRVKGLVAKLVRVSESKATTALEIAAGSKLYQVVVDTEQTGKLLIEKGGLRKRVTILPLNKISSRCTDAAKVSAAKEIARAHGGSANLALELVGYDAEVKKAMEYVFGNVIICDTSDVAKAVAFDRSVRNKTVTLEGDAYDPSGTLTGGSSNQLGVLLGKIEELASAQEALAGKRQELQAIETHLGRLEADSAAARDLSSELEIKRHALKMCEDKVSESDYAQSMAEIDVLEKQISACEAVS